MSSMKSIVFDNAGTILKRITVLNDVVHNKLIYETNTIGIANQKKSRIIVVLQESVNELSRHTGTLYNYLKDNMEYFEISYSQINILKSDVVDVLANDSTSFHDLFLATNTLIENYDVEIISGCALIIDMDNGMIEYVYTAGGVFFEDTRRVMNFINNSPLSIYIASGDNKESLSKIASILKIPKSNVYSTLNREGKYNLVNTLQRRGDYVYMVGNHTNDQLAIEAANTGILTLEQGENVPDMLKDSADHIIYSIGDVISIIKKNRGD